MASKDKESASSCNPRSQAEAKEPDQCSTLKCFSFLHLSVSPGPYIALVVPYEHDYDSYFPREAILNSCRNRPTICRKSSTSSLVKARLVGKLDLKHIARALIGALSRIKGGLR
jgi:hypothetical protein